MSAAADAPRSGPSTRILRGLINLVFGTLFCLTPVTALLVLGWLMRHMRNVALRSAGMQSHRPGWILGAPGSRWDVRMFGGLAANIREGLLAALSLALATLPFTSIWLLSWWAGWENSFSKGYEQAFVGPLLGIGGVALFSLTMIYLPIALAHQAVENRALALFEFRPIRSALRHTGWSYLFLAVATVIAALPFFASRALITFASEAIPGFDEMTIEEVMALGGQIDLALAGWAFLALYTLRGWTARIYASAVARARACPDAALWQGSALVQSAPKARPWALAHWLRMVALAVIWFGLSAQIYVGQFLNHDWHLWLTHPLIFLPWPG